MIDIRKLKELVRLMVHNDLTELDLRDKEEQVTLRRPSASAAPPIAQHAVMPIHSSAPYSLSHVPTHAIAPATPAAAPAGPPAAAADDTAGLQPIASPMVGTFYASGKPDSPPFIKVGDHVSPDTVVCIIEAMKIFNEIKAEATGTVRKILAKNATSVEFGQALFLIQPD
jgi:acetyl-CoA carboxylase biotin carboxyl carrier protein